MWLGLANVLNGTWLLLSTWRVRSFPLFVLTAQAATRGLGAAITDCR